MKKILVLMYDGVEELELIAPIDVCKRAKISIDVCSMENSNVKSAHGIYFTNLLKYEDIKLEDYDALFIPGGPHYKKMEADSRVIEAIMYFYNENKYIFGICAAPTIFGHLGLLKNKEYTCFTSMNEDFGGTYIDTYSVVDLPFVTGRSAAAAIDFGFDIIKVLLGEEIVKQVKDAIYY